MTDMDTVDSRLEGLPVYAPQDVTRDYESPILGEGYTFTGSDNPEVPHRAHFCACDTTVDFTMYGDKNQARHASMLARNTMRGYELLFSRTMPMSDVTRINKAGTEPVHVHPLTAKLIEESIKYSQRSEGVFDITMGTVTHLWDFKEGIIPTAEDIAEAMTHVGYDKIEVYMEKSFWCIRKKDAATRIDLGGTAKGFIADKLADIFEEEGIEHFLLNLGGNIIAKGGKPNGDPFRIGVKNPQDREKVLAAVPLVNGSVVTSGMYERAFTLNGKRYAHILDTKTGMPVETDVEGVTVVAENGTDCDGFSTTLCALGMEAGKKFVSSHREISMAVFVDKDNHIEVVS